MVKDNISPTKKPRNKNGQYCHKHSKNTYKKTPKKNKTNNHQEMNRNPTYYYENDEIPTFRTNRPTAIVKHRKYRGDKHHPRRLKVSIIEDFKEIEQTQTFYMESNTRRTTKRKYKNGNLVYLMKTPLKIAYYLNSKRCFVYDLNGNFAAELEKKDLNSLYSRIGHLRRYKK